MKEKYNEIAKVVFHNIHSSFQDFEVTRVQIFGEQFGGLYDGKTEKGHKKIQKEVQEVENLLQF